MAEHLEGSHDTEREEARRLQQAMIPREPLTVHPFQIACLCRPALSVGGDFLDYFILPYERLDFYLGDVVGKGLPAALYGALAFGMLRGMNKRGETPQALLGRFNQRLLFYALPGRFCASQYGMFDPATRTLTFSSAGLPLPMHITPRGCHVLGEGGLPSGMFQGASYEPYSVRLEPGESVVFYTDGIVEAAGQAQEEFGVERLMRVCERSKDQSAPDLLHSVFRAADAFMGGVSQHDDMTAVALKMT